MVISDVGDEDIMMMGYMFSIEYLRHDLDEREGIHALCLRACALGSTDEEMRSH